MIGLSFTVIVLLKFLSREVRRKNFGIWLWSVVKVWNFAIVWSFKIKRKINLERCKKANIKYSLHLRVSNLFVFSFNIEKFASNKSQQFLLRRLKFYFFFRKLFYQTLNILAFQRRQKSFLSLTSAIAPENYGPGSSPIINFHFHLRFSDKTDSRKCWRKIDLENHKC